MLFLLSSPTPTLLDECTAHTHTYTLISEVQSSHDKEDLK